MTLFTHDVNMRLRQVFGYKWAALRTGVMHLLDALRTR